MLPHRRMSNVRGSHMYQRFFLRYRRRGLAGLALGALLGGVLAVVATAPANAAGADGRAYVSNFGNDTVSVVDTATQSIVDTVAVGDGPQGITVNSAGTAVYVVNQNARTVSVIDTSTDTVSATVTIGGTGTPSYDILNPAGTHLYVTDQGAGTSLVYDIDTATNAVVGTVLTAGAAQGYGLAISSNGSLLYVAVANAGAVAVINTSTDTISAVVAVGTVPTDVALRPGSSEAYVPNNQGSNVSVFDTTTNLQTTTIATQFGPYFADFNAAGTRAYVTQSVGYVSVIDASSQAVLTTVHVTGDPWTPKVDPTGAFVYVVNNALNAVQLIGTSDNTVDNTITGFNQPRDIAFGPAAGADIAVGVSAQTLNLLSPAIRFTLTAHNLGPDPVTAATLTASIPPGITATNLSPGCSQSGASVACTFGTIATGSTGNASFDLPVALLQIGTVTVNATRTSSAPPDPNPANDNASASCTVVSIVLALC
jgi:YVTN family beta-propeller protein